MDLVSASRAEAALVAAATPASSVVWRKERRGSDVDIKFPFGFKFLRICCVKGNPQKDELRIRRRGLIRRLQPAQRSMNPRFFISHLPALPPWVAPLSG